MKIGQFVQTPLTIGRQKHMCPKVRFMCHFPAEQENNNNTI